jgi:SAM-dependent methyltransferase
VVCFNRGRVAHILAHFDEPDGPISAAYFHARGWVAADAALGSIEIEVNGQLYPVSRYPRPDVQSAYAKLHTTGFSAFPRLWDFDWQRGIRLRVLHQGEIVAEQAVSLAAGVSIDAAAQGAARLAKREWLRGKVNCPRCHARLDANFSCASCGKSYLTPSGSLALMPADSSGTWEFQFGGAVCQHGYDGDVGEILDEVESRGGYVLDCGAGLRPRVNPHVVTVEIADFPTTDVLGINQQLPFADGIFDAVLSLHVLEHVSDPFQCADELIRVLKPGGKLLAVTPMIVPEHGFPHHFYNPTRKGLEHLFRRLRMERLFIPYMGHPINGVRTVLEIYRDCLPADQRTKFLKMSVSDLLSGALVDAIGQAHCTSLNEEGRWRLAANYCIVASKPA